MGRRKECWHVFAMIMKGWGRLRGKLVIWEVNRGLCRRPVVVSQSGQRDEWRWREGQSLEGPNWKDLCRGQLTSAKVILSGDYLAPVYCLCLLCLSVASPCLLCRSPISLMINTRGAGHAWLVPTLEADAGNVFPPSLCSTPLVRSNRVSVSHEILMFVCLRQ